LSHPEPATPFDPDERIDKMRILLHTADVSDAGTDSDIFVDFFGTDWTEIDTDGYNDFEKGDTRWYDVDYNYFAGHIVKDLVQFNILKGDDNGSDWAYGGAQLEVNSRWYFTPAFTDEPYWMTDGDVLTIPNFPRLDFVTPTLKSLGLPDAGPDEDYSFTLQAEGGNPGETGLTWQLINQKGDVFPAGVTLNTTSATGRTAEFKGHTDNTTLNKDWNGTLVLTDADGRKSEKLLEMRLVITLPPPTVLDFSPTFGWPDDSPAAIEPVSVTIRSKDKDFDSRQEYDSGKQGKTDFFFQGSLSIGKNLIQAEVIECISTTAFIWVPQGAVPGPIEVKTKFGEVRSDDPTNGMGDKGTFVAHPSGYRFVNGFSFVNDPELFPRSFDWERYEETFGTDEMWVQTPVGDKNILPNPIAANYYLTTTEFLDQGCCHGFTLGSLQMKEGLWPPWQYVQSNNAYPLAKTLCDLASPEQPSLLLSHFIQSRQLVMWSDEALTFFLDKLDDIPEVSPCVMDARPALTQVNNYVLDSSIPHMAPYMIAFSKGCITDGLVGHVTVPYKIEPEGQNQNIKVYDPNRPANKDNATDKNDPNQPNDNGSMYWVNPTNGMWSYTFSTLETWGGWYMFAIPLRDPGYGDLYHWSLPGLGTFFESLAKLHIGCAGTDANADVLQIQDQHGKTLFDQNHNIIGNRANWPEGVGLFPNFGGENKHRMFALTDTVSLTFSVSPHPNTTGFFTTIRGPFVSFCIDDFNQPLKIDFFPKKEYKMDSIKIAPEKGRGSAILRVSNLLASESLSYAVRVNGIDPLAPVEFASTMDQRGVIVSSKGAALNVDVQVIHQSRNARERIFECDGIGIPKGAVAQFSVSHFEDLDNPVKKPLIFDLDSNASGHFVLHSKLGQRLEGISIVAPQRIIVQMPEDAQPNSKANSEIDVSKSKTVFHNSPLNFRVLNDSQWEFDSGKLKANLDRGTHVYRIVAEDASGHRSFPRTVMVTVPEKGKTPTPICTLFLQDVMSKPGSDSKVALTMYTYETPVVGVTGKISIEKRLSGLGKKSPELSRFSLSPVLTGVNAQLKLKVNTRSIRFDIIWDQDKPLSGNIDLGQLIIKISPDVQLGSSFHVSCEGSIKLKSDNGEAQESLNGLPSIVRVWGGRELRQIKIDGPDEARVQNNIKLKVTGAGMSQIPDNVGWWIEKVTGLAIVEQDAIDHASAKLTGLRVGIIMVRSVVGTKTASKIVYVKA
jgi:hypothetical protein